jgi:tRNA-splicing ligase RtcB
MPTVSRAQQAGKETDLVLNEIGPFRYLIPRGTRPGMRTDGLIFASPAMLDSIRSDHAGEQVANVAALPGIVGRSLAMPDIHWGYGFPIGGVAAMDADEGVVSPGGVGYDINCGVRLIRTNLSESDVRPRMKELVRALSDGVPAGVGGHGTLNTRGSMDEVMSGGAEWAVEEGFGWTQDLPSLEEGGRMEDADPSKVSERARRRGSKQVGSLGSGNHFLEVQAVDAIEDKEAASACGLTSEGQVAIMLHTGSRGLGHQVCSDHLEVLDGAAGKWDIPLPDRQLASAPLKSREADDYLGAMFAAANFAWANRQVITDQTRKAFASVIGRSAEEMDMHVVYDVCHNMAKLEEHDVDGKRRRLLVHRKGATRAFGPGRPEVPSKYRDHGQPVLVPGSMATGSWLLTANEAAMSESWGSSCHGAGRRLSRSAAKKQFPHEDVIRDMDRQGIVIRATTKTGVTEEAPGAYKDVDDVVAVVDAVGIARKTVRLKPLGVVKG